MKKPLLDVQNLSASFSIQGRRLQAVRNASFQLFEGEAIGIVGESGCGKSALVQSLLRLVPTQIETGRVFFEGVDLLSLSLDKLRAVRGRGIGMVFQDPMTALNPTMSIGMQIGESLLHHRITDKKGARARSLELLKLTGVPDPEIRLSQFPHQLSGGMRQRVLIAIALAASPRILIADEPTTALDPTVQAQIVYLLKELRIRLQMSQIIITHDIGAVASLCDRILVMYAGKIVEEGSVQNILQAPRHPYTKMLLHSLPTLASKRGEKLFTIEGSPPSLFSPPHGCPFAARCPHAMKICAQESPPINQSAACWLYDERYLDASAALIR